MIPKLQISKINAWNGFVIMVGVSVIVWDNKSMFALYLYALCYTQNSFLVFIAQALSL